MLLYIVTSTVLFKYYALLIKYKVMGYYMFVISPLLYLNYLVILAHAL